MYGTLEENVGVNRGSFIHGVGAKTCKKWRKERTGPSFYVYFTQQGTRRKGYSIDSRFRSVQRIERKRTAGKASLEYFKKLVLFLALKNPAWSSFPEWHSAWKRSRERRGCFLKKKKYILKKLYFLPIHMKFPLENAVTRLKREKMFQDAFNKLWREEKVCTHFLGNYVSKPTQSRPDQPHHPFLSLIHHYHLIYQTRTTTSRPDLE